MTAAAFIAVNRFGLGAVPHEALPADPQGWLLAQFEQFQTRAAPWQTLPGTELLWPRYLEAQRAVRVAGDADRTSALDQLVAQRREAYAAAVAARLRSAAETPAPFIERLVHFWANHFAVSIEKPQVLLLAGAYEAEAIRPHVLGRFEDLLLAVVRHPAMLLYLDQAASIGPDSPVGLRAAQRDPQRRRGLNENLAREVLELHTVGVGGGYAQADVTELARALTGWSVQAPADAPASVSEQALTWPEAPGYVFRPRVHEPGTRTVMGRRYAAGDEAQARAILHDLALAPATARFVALKLARHFIADEPPAAAVDALAAAFLRSGGDLPTVYRALVGLPQAWAHPHAKFKTPWDWALSSARALGLREVEGRIGAGMLQQLGQPVWRPGSPAGFDDVAASWVAPDALVRRVDMAQRLAMRATAAADPRELATRLLPSMSDATSSAIARADSRATGLALLLVAPEFLRR